MRRYDIRHVESEEQEKPVPAQQQDVWAGSMMTFAPILRTGTEVARFWGALLVILRENNE
jgi:hypothetical protein